MADPQGGSLQWRQPPIKTINYIIYIYILISIKRSSLSPHPSAARGDAPVERRRDLKDFIWSGKVGPKPWLCQARIGHALPCRSFAARVVRLFKPCSKADDLQLCMPIWCLGNIPTSCSSRTASPHQRPDQWVLHQTEPTWRQLADVDVVAVKLANDVRDWS